MSGWRKVAAFTPMACLLMAVSAHADGGLYQHGTSRTFFDRFPVPASTPHAWTPGPCTFKIFGCRVCKTPEAKYQKFMREYQILQAQHANRVANLHWSHYYNYMNPAPRPDWRCDCGGGCKKPGCTKTCGACGGGCQEGCQVCDKCAAKGHGGHGVAGHGLFGNGGNGAGGAGGANGQYPVVGYPQMNREDAVRYVEGMQYYPPYQTIRSPRDFFMFNEKYGLGQP